jgi:DNA-binding ferritin-like protein
MNNIEIINNLLKDELSAAETYQKVIVKFREDVGISEAQLLVPIYEDHLEAVSTLQSQIRQLGGAPLESFGVYEAWTGVVQGGAKLTDIETALKSLLEGETSGTEDYEEALQDNELTAEVRSLIKSTLLPVQQSHIFNLDRLINIMT